MKHLIFLVAALCVVFASCDSDSASEVERVSGRAQVPVTVRVDGFAVDQADFDAPALTRAATAPGSYDGVKAVTLAFYDSGTARQAYCATQLKADNSTYATFGNFELTLPVGSYKMIVLGYNSSYPVVFRSMTDVVFGEEKSRETFCHTQDVVIDEETPVDLTATLRRIVTRLNVQSADTRTAEATQVRVTLSKGGRTFNPITGFATSDDGFVNVATTSTAVGATSLTTVNFFIAEEDATMDVAIETLDDEGHVLFSKVVSGVSFRRNRVSKLTGAMYHIGNAAGAFTLETEWMSDLAIDF